MILNSPYISGSLTVTGNIVASGSITLSGSVASASFAANAATASFVTLAQTASFVTTAQTASFVANAQSASNAVTAQTASFANALTVAGTLTAQTLVVQTITSSVDFVTGSTRFGSIISNTHQFTGSVGITGSLTGVSATLSGDLTVATTALFLNSSNSRLGLGTITPSTRLHIVDSGNNFLTLQRTGVSTGSGQFNVNIESNSQTTVSYDATGSYVIGTSTDPKTQAGFSQKFALSSAGAATFASSVTAASGLYNGYTSGLPPTTGGATRGGLRLNNASNIAFDFGTVAAGQAWIQISDANNYASNFALLLNPNGGNVGIGTTNPLSSLDTTTNSSGGNLLNNTADVVARFGNINTNPGNHYSSGIQVFQGTGTLGSGYAVGFLTADNNTATAQQQNVLSLTAPVSMSGGINLIAADASSTIRMFTGGYTNERMRITSGGNIVIGTASTGRRLNVGSTTTPGFFHNTSNAAGQYCHIWQLGGSETVANSSYYLYCDTDNIGVRVVIYGNGNIANVNNSYGAYSDIKLKENITDATPKLDDLLKVKIRNFNLKGDDKKQIGVVAQELEEIFPGLIEESDDTIKNEDGEYIKTGEKTKTVKYSVFIPMLIKAIQELKAEFDEYKSTHP